MMTSMAQPYQWLSMLERHRSLRKVAASQQAAAAEASIRVQVLQLWLDLLTSRPRRLSVSKNKHEA